MATSELALEVAGLGPLETSRIWGRYSVIKLYDKILKQCKLGNRNKITRDIIVEDTVPDIGYVNFGHKLCHSVWPCLKFWCSGGTNAISTIGHILRTSGIFLNLTNQTNNFNTV